MPELPSGAGCDARLVYRRGCGAYDYGEQHPLRPDRLRTSLDLFDAAGLGPRADQVLALPAATEAELGLVHTPAYVEAGQRLDIFGFLDHPAAWSPAPRRRGIEQESAARVATLLDTLQRIIPRVPAVPGGA